MGVTSRNSPKFAADGIRALRVAIRLAALLAHALLGILVQLGLWTCSKLVPIDNARTIITRFWHRVICRLIGVRIHALGTVPAGAHLVVSNHVSWLDIPVLGAVLPVTFLSKAEVRRWPLFGVLATMANTIYIERGAHGARAVAEQLVAQLNRGQSVVLFPEGTTSDGRSVRRFIPRLFMAAIDSQCGVQPVAIRYPAAQGGQSVAPFFGGARMGGHLLRVLAEPSVEVCVTLCQPIHGQRDRRRLTELSHRAIRVVIEQDLRN